MGRSRFRRCWICFNPHPSRRTGATYVVLAEYNHMSFQSSPVPKDGRYDVSHLGRPPNQSFNPHPSRRTGATHRCQHFIPPDLVSILTRPEGRALPADSEQWKEAQGFQSSPVPKDGRYALINRIADADDVSILTRPEGRALPAADTTTCSNCGSFNPHPSRRTGATGMAPGLHRSLTSFNPHPSRRTGATVAL